MNPSLVCFFRSELHRGTCAPVRLCLNAKGPSPPISIFRKLGETYPAFEINFRKYKRTFLIICTTSIQKIINCRGSFKRLEYLFFFYSGNIWVWLDSLYANSGISNHFFLHGLGIEVGEGWGPSFVYEQLRARHGELVISIGRTRPRIEVCT